MKRKKFKIFKKQFKMSLFWARRGVCDEFFYSCRQTNGKALFIARKYHAMSAIVNRKEREGF